MRKRPSSTYEKMEKFINEAPENLSENETITEDYHKYVKVLKWPIFPEDITPSLATGSKLKKGLNLQLKEYEWNSIDRHTKKLKVAKTEWIRYAILKLLQEEQLHFLKMKDK